MSQPLASISEFQEELPDIETQLDSATRLGHRLGGVSGDGGTPPMVQAKSTKYSGESETTSEIEDVIQQARNGGQTLDNDVRAQMESSFGADFQGVRVHADSKADMLNRSVNARAFATGSDIFFRDGEYSPNSSTGRELLAHELAHVVQQTQGLAREPLEERDARESLHSIIQRADAADVAKPTSSSDKGSAEEPKEDPAIDGLNLSPTAKKAAQKLKKDHPKVEFTSGQRSVADQAHAMATNIVSSNNRKWIEETYASAAKLQKWVDDNPKATSVKDIADGLERTMNAMSDDERKKVSKHLTGDAFDVQPVKEDAEKIKNDIKGLPGVTKFLEKEGGLVRWHAQFKLAGREILTADKFEQEADNVAKQIAHAPRGHLHRKMNGGGSNSYQPIDKHVLQRAGPADIPTETPEARLRRKATTIVQTLAQVVVRADSQGDAGVTITIRHTDEELVPGFTRQTEPHYERPSGMTYTTEGTVSRELKPILDQILLSGPGEWQIVFGRTAGGQMRWQGTRRAPSSQATAQAAQQTPAPAKGLPPEETARLRQQMEADRDLIIARLDVTWYSDNDETQVMKIIYKWAFRPNPPDQTDPSQSYYLQALFTLLQDKKNKSNVSYYDLLFSRSDDYARELEELRNYRAPAFRTTSKLKDEGLSYELAAAPKASDVSSTIPWVTDDQKRVLGWLRDHLSEIVGAETQFKIDRRAIAGAIAWEALENVRGAWTPSSVGPGKVHIRTHRVAGENTAAKQVEEAGYVPKQTFAKRKEILATSGGAINYIGAIMKAFADIAWEEKSIEISKDPVILAYLYQSHDLVTWRAQIKNKPQGEELSPGDFAKNMGRWVQIHMPYLEEAVGRPSFAPMHKPAAPSAAPVQRYATGSAPSEYTLAVVGAALESPGQSLDAQIRVLMEQDFGYDFSQVRIHTNTQANASARAVNAFAYTVGNDVVFGDGRYTPQTNGGKKLLAHELAHVVQQRGEITQRLNSWTVSDPSSPLERQARSAADAFSQARPFTLLDRQPTTIAREENDAGVPVEDAGTPVDASAQPPAAAPASESTPPPAPASASAPATPAPMLAASAVACPIVPAKKVLAAICPLPTPVAGMTPPKVEPLLPLPMLGDMQFGGDTTVETFAKQLAACRAGRVAESEVNKRYATSKEQAKKAAQAQAKVDKEQAVTAAVAAVTETDKKKRATAIAKAKRDAAAQADREAKGKTAEAVAAVSKPDLATVQAELETENFGQLADDFKKTMQAVLVQFGPGWQARAKKVLDKAKTRQDKKLKAKPKVKKGETPPPQRTPEEINAELEAFLVQQRCQQTDWIQNQFESVKHAWMVGRREQLDFETIEQKGVKSMARGFKAPREVPADELMPIPPELKPSGTAPGVAPEVVGFLRELQKLEPVFHADNYHGHGSWGFVDKGYSLDLAIDGKSGALPLDDRGFWGHKAAQRAGAEWRVLYNDFSVAEEVNKTLSFKRVTFIGNLDKSGKVNWHGPAPLKLHFHLDIAPTASLPIQ